MMSFVRVRAQSTDIRWLRQINVHRDTRLDPAMHLISDSEAGIGIGIPLGVGLAAWATHKSSLLEKSMVLSAALLLNTVHTTVLKHAINRDRPGVTYPDIQALETEKHYSFPSGHTSNAFCDATALSLYFRKWYVIVPAYTWACAVGYSRMHLGMHYPSDVLAGALTGAGSAWLTYQANRKLKIWFQQRYGAARKPE